MFNLTRWRVGGDLREAASHVGPLTAAWVGAVGLAVQMVLYAIRQPELLFADARAYWLAGRAANPYGGMPGELYAFLYSPAIHEALQLVAWLPWQAFATLFVAINAAAFWWLTKPLPWRLRAPVLIMCGTELLNGNINALLAVALVVGVTRPEALAFPALTKITPGAVGFLWHLARGDVHAVVRGALVTLALASLSFAAEPQLWVDWMSMLLAADHGGPGSTFGFRLVAGLTLAVYAARSGRSRWLAVAFWLALPVAGFALVTPMTVMVAAIRLPARSPKPASARQAVDAAA